jgi:putative transposase
MTAKRRNHMSRKRKTYSKNFKAKVALDALKELKTLTQISAENGVHPNIIRKWKEQVRQSLPDVFDTPLKSKELIDEKEVLIKNLFEKIGRLEMDLEWLKKKQATLS